jgi:hypothetical protein
MALVRARNPAHHHVSYGDDSDFALMLLCLPPHLNLTAAGAGGFISSDAITRWVHHMAGPAERAAVTAAARDQVSMEQHGKQSKQGKGGGEARPVREHTGARGRRTLAAAPSSRAAQLAGQVPVRAAAMPQFSRPPPAQHVAVSTKLPDVPEMDFMTSQLTAVRRVCSRIFHCSSLHS